jgi:carboxyl-terminal processing protease
VIRTQSVRSRIIEPGYAFVRVSQFQERTVEDLARHLSDAQKAGPLKGIVLDLRNDPGGLLHSAIGVSAAFLPKRALVVTTDGRMSDAKRRFVAAPEDYQRGRGEDVLARLPAEVKSVPMVVLVNGASASASEIVAGALQDHKRATVIGSQTFGKGSVQTIIPLRSDGERPAAIKLTTARYFTPNGRSIQAKGIEPDLHVDDTAQGSFAGLQVREADLARHLEVKQAAPGPGGAAARETSAESPAESHADRPAPPRYEFGSAEDFQLRQAMNHLKGLPVETARKGDNVAASATGAR